MARISARTALGCAVLCGVLLSGCGEPKPGERPGGTLVPEGEGAWEFVAPASPRFAPGSSTAEATRLEWLDAEMQGTCANGYEVTDRVVSKFFAYNTTQTHKIRYKVRCTGT